MTFVQTVYQIKNFGKKRINTKRISSEENGIPFNNLIHIKGKFSISWVPVLHVHIQI